MSETFVRMMNRNEAPWYVADLQPLGWAVRAQKFTDGPREDDPPIGLFAEQSYARLACDCFNIIRQEQA